MDKLYSVREVSEILNISKLTVYRLIEKGVIKSINIGTIVRVKKSSIDELLERSKGND